MRKVPPLDLYLVTDRAMCERLGILRVVGEAVAGGVTMVQLRDDETPTEELIQIARRLMEALEPAGVPLIVNNRLDVAQAASADGIHVGTFDAPAPLARAAVRPGGLVGVSITNLARLDEVDPGDADYLGVGPIFPTATKSNADPPIGLSGLAGIRARTQLPIVAIGGVGEGNAAATIAAGADGIAVVSAICAAADPGSAATGLARIVAAAKAAALEA